MKYLGLLLLVCGAAVAQTTVTPLPVQPAAVTSPTLTLTATSTACTVTGGTQTISVPVPAAPVTPPVIPPVVPSSIVYQNGLINWTFNMSYGAGVNYQDTAGAPATGTYDAAITVPSAGGWQPGFSVACQNGGTGCFDTSLYTYFVFSIKPTQGNTIANLIMAWHQPGDVADGNGGLSISQYCSAAVGIWGSCKVPLAAFGFSNKVVSKFTLQSNVPALFYVNNVGFQ